MVAIAPGFTIGFVRPSSLCSIASSELNGSPVALTPTALRTASGPTVAQTSAKTNGFATLMSVNSASSSPTPYTSPARADDADAEVLGRGRCERRIHLRHLAVLDGAVALVGLVDEGADALVGRQRAGRDERRGIEGHLGSSGPRMDGIEYLLSRRRLSGRCRDDRVRGPAPALVHAGARRALSGDGAARRLVRRERRRRGDHRRLLPPRPVPAARRARDRRPRRAARARDRALRASACVRLGRRRGRPAGATRGGGRRLRPSRRAGGTAARPGRRGRLRSGARSRGLLLGLRAVRLGHHATDGIRARHWASRTTSSSPSPATDAVPAWTAGWRCSSSRS